MVLEDAVISLCNEDGGSEYQIGETNEEGKVIFNIFLSPGTFYYPCLFTINNNNKYVWIKQ